MESDGLWVANAEGRVAGAKCSAVVRRLEMKNDIAHLVLTEPSNGRKKRGMQSRAKQLSFFESTSLCFGGTLLKNSHARTSRPINTKQALHVVLKSELAVGSLAMTRKSQEIKGIIAKQSKVFGVTTSKLAIASNHIHLLVYASRRRRIVGWLRAVSGLIARLMLKAEKGSPSKLSFWTYRPFTRVVFWGVDFRRVLAYLEKNILQATGFFPIPQATSSG